MRFWINPKIAASMIFLIIILLFGIIESYILGQGPNFNQHLTLLNAIYFTITTISTVGYGDIVPISSTAKVFVIILIILGLGAFLTTISFISGEIMDTRINKLTSKLAYLESRNVKGHILLLGAGSVNMAYAQNLKKLKQRYILVIQNKEDADRLISDGYTVINADITSEEVLKKLNPQKAQKIIIDLRHKENILYTTLILSDIEYNKNKRCNYYKSK